MKLKGLILLLAVVVCGIFESHAQRIEEHFYSSARYRRMEMGVVAGGAYLFTSMPEAINASAKLGFRAALQMSYIWQERCALQLEIGYLHNKIEAGAESNRLDVKSNVLEIPLLFSYRGLGRMRFNVGPQFSLGGTARYQLPTEKIEFGRLRSTVGYVLGVGVDLSRHLLLEARYTGNFRQTLNYFEGMEFDSRSSWATLSIGYMF